MKQNTPNQRGSAIIWILIAIGLFAALSVAFTSTSRQSTSLLTNEQASAYANQIIAYGNDVKQAVKRLKLRGCSDTEISFENTVRANYINPNSPTDRTCHVFDIAGAGLNWLQQPPETLFGSHAYLNDYIFSGNNIIPDIGEFAGELIMQAIINDKICERINLALENSPAFPPITDPGGFNLHSASEFKGNYTTAATINAYPAPTSTGCFFDGSTGNPSSQKYVFYKVLIAR